MNTICLNLTVIQTVDAVMAVDVGSAIVVVALVEVVDVVDCYFYAAYHSDGSKWCLTVPK